MGVDFSALFEHRLTWEELYDLPSRLQDALPSLPSPVAPDEIRRYNNAWSWSRDRDFSNVQEELFETGHVSFDGPAGYMGTVFRRGVELTHLARWWSFVYDDSVAATLRHACRLFGAVLNARHVLYIPDSAFPPELAIDQFFDGATFGEVCDWLEKEVAPPQFSTEKLRIDNEEILPEGYILEALQATDST